MRTPDDRSLAERLREIEDRVAIRELTARYNRAIDDANADEFAATYTEDGRFWIGRDGRLTDGRRHLRNMSKVAGFGMVHMTFDPIITIDGDTATQRCYAIIGRRTPERAPGSSQWVTSGCYTDDLVRTDDGWLFKQRVWEEDAVIEGLPDW
jgi:uncharacterized protein (TIGR02246 family)